MFKIQPEYEHRLAGTMKMIARIVYNCFHIKKFQYDIFYVRHIAIKMPYRARTQAEVPSCFNRQLYVHSKMSE